MQIDDGSFRGGATGREAVAELGILLREKEKTRRLLIAAACLLFIVASLVIVFAPAGKETASVILGVVLIIFALGSIGVAAFNIKAGGVEVSTGNVPVEPHAQNRTPQTPA
jgi:hypothetical protein